MMRFPGWPMRCEHSSRGWTTLHVHYAPRRPMVSGSIGNRLDFHALVLNFRTICSYDNGSEV